MRTLSFLLMLLLVPCELVANSLIAVHPTSPWTLRELEGLGLELVSHDPQSGLTYLIASRDDMRRLRERSFTFSTVEPDWKARLRELQEIPGLGLYHTWSETVAELESLHATFPSITRLEVIGQSLEGRDIPALKISDDASFDDPAEADVLIVGNHHARELMSVEVPLHVARHLLEQYGRAPRTTQLVDEREIWIVPLLNADGHVYQEETQLQPGWRKNRRRLGDDVMGVDLNRNYSYLWGFDDTGSSPDPLSQTYRGSHAFSEPESDAIRRLSERQEFKLAISYHSFGQLLLYPWGWTRNMVTPDHSVFVALADSMVRDSGYRPGNAYSGAIYITNGAFGDYMYGERNDAKETRTFSFTVELNSMAQGGFWPSEDLIRPTCELLLSLNLYAIRVADNVRAATPPPPPLLTAVQDGEDPRIIYMSWSDTGDEHNPIDHFEIFEIDPIGQPSPPKGTSTTLHASGRTLVASDLRVPSGGDLVLDLETRLEPLWDYAYVEVRRLGSGAWVSLSGEVTREANPTGRNQGAGITGWLARTARFDAARFAGERVDVAVRIDAHPDSPTDVALRARLDVAQTLTETRRVLVPDVRDTTYTLVAERPGLFAYGVTAVDAEGQRSDSDLAWFYIPEVVAVGISDIRVHVEGRRAELRWRVASSSDALFEVWTRALDVRDSALGVAEEWGSRRHRLVASTRVTMPGEVRLPFQLEPGRHVLLLRGADRDGERLWGPWVVEVSARTFLDVATPNPFNPSTRLHFELEHSAYAELDVVSVRGRRVRRLWSGTRPAGRHAVDWDGRDDTGRGVASGHYVARLRVGSQTWTRRLLLLR
ncbi:MAG: hypothetical protein JSW67_06460 [Candidatus Latescibacterota bacterium]|nr:MAG: hypothetical protein JSW67_06460 [Candidatus Latescibacterota bacterium]